MKLRIYPPQSKSLREALETEGFRFPCGGKGICGRCRINAPALQPTALDRRFFSSVDISKGIRLACDKNFDSPIEIDCYLDKSPAARKLYEPLVTAVLGDNISEISIVEDGIVETLVLPSPQADTVPLRSLVGKHAIELYEKYGVSKAAVMLVAGTTQRMSAFCGKAQDGLLGLGDTLPAASFDMPAEDVYLPPYPCKYAGSLELLELDAVPDGSLLVLCGQSYTFLYKGETIIAAAGFPSTGDTTITARAAAATLKYLDELYSPSCRYAVGGLPAEVEEYLACRNIVLRHKESAATERAAAAIADNRYKTRLNKLSRKAIDLELAEDERWQDILSSI